MGTFAWVLAAPGSPHAEAFLDLFDCRIEVRVCVNDVVDQQRAGGTRGWFRMLARYAFGEQRWS